MSRQSPRVTFVVLNWNQAELTLACLDSLAAQAYDNHDVVIVDNGSVDASVERIRRKYSKVRVVTLEENRGYSEGNNVGIRAALESGADYIYLLNNDTEVAPDMLSRLVEVAESNSEIGIVGPSVFYADTIDVLWGGGSYIDWKRGTINRVGMGSPLAANIRSIAMLEVDYMDSCAVLVRRRAFESVGYLSRDYFINFDDLDFSLRVRRAKFRIVYVPQASVWHKVSAAMGVGSPATTYFMTRNQLLVFWRHSPRRWRIVAVGAITLRTIRTIVAWSVRPRYQMSVYQRKRDMNVLAIRDFLLGRFGPMGSDVARRCYES